MPFASKSAWLSASSASRAHRDFYLRAWTYQSPEWATAALLRIGQGYEAYAKAHARRARAQGSQRSRKSRSTADELEKVVVVIEEQIPRRLQIWLRARIADRRLHNKHNRKPCREALSRLAENEVPKEAELRLKARPGEPRNRAGADRRGAP